MLQSALYKVYFSIKSLKIKTSLPILPSITEGPGELALTAGDVATMVEQVDSEWYRGTCRGVSGFFPANFVKVLVSFSFEITVIKI